MNPCNECNKKQCEICDFRKYLEADKEGLFLFLPCKVGDVAYYEQTECHFSGNCRKSSCDCCNFSTTTKKTVEILTIKDAIQVMEDIDKGIAVSFKEEL